MGKKVELKERNTNETLYPITLTENVLLPDSSTLTDKLTLIDQKIESCGVTDAIKNMLDWYEG